MSLVSSKAVRFTLVRLDGGRVYPGSFGSLGFALGVFGFIRGRWVYSVLPLWSLGNPGSLEFALGSLGSSGVVGFT